MFGWSSFQTFVSPLFVAPDMMEQTEIEFRGMDALKNSPFLILRVFLVIDVRKKNKLLKIDNI
ncbi:hypothetical protein AA0498_2314 [Acidomonas methanolica]|nr:hypothetical protein AA0498_2314 [Acidomonas methanolica]